MSFQVEIETTQTHSTPFGTNRIGKNCDVKIIIPVKYSKWVENLVLVQKKWLYKTVYNLKI